ncbi:hypothetical protein K438DRAFT_1783182 [Mycena galopus ATCC 62051]|nr:hypothetical protein K438DRAFT_1783182 [Mycena galopus ATCC 62051]
MAAQWQCGEVIEEEKRNATQCLDYRFLAPDALSVALMPDPMFATGTAMRTVSFKDDVMDLMDGVGRAGYGPEDYAQFIQSSWSCEDERGKVCPSTLRCLRTRHLPQAQVAARSHLHCLILTTHIKLLKLGQLKRLKPSQAGSIMVHEVEGSKIQTNITLYFA